MRAWTTDHQLIPRGGSGRPSTNPSINEKNMDTIIPLLIILLSTFLVTFCFTGLKPYAAAWSYISSLEFHLVAPPAPAQPATPVVVEEIKVQGFPTGPGTTTESSAANEAFKFVAGLGMLIWGGPFVLGFIITMVSGLGALIAAGGALVLSIAAFVATVIIPLVVLIVMISVVVNWAQNA